MKGFMKKATVVLLSALFILGVYTPVTKAATNQVIVHVQDNAKWGSMNVYNWGDDGETAGIWPGTAMTDEGNHWYSYTFDTTCDLNLVFSADGGKPQSGDLGKIAPDAGEVWIVIGGGSGESNDYAADTVNATLYTEAEEGWPTAAAVTEDKAEEPTATDTTDAASTTTDTESTNLPKTGEKLSAPIILLSLAALSVVTVLSITKKEAKLKNNN